MHRKTFFKLLCGGIAGLVAAPRSVAEDVTVGHGKLFVTKYSRVFVSGNPPEYQTIDLEKLNLTAHWWFDDGRQGYQIDPFDFASRLRIPMARTWDVRGPHTVWQHSHELCAFLLRQRGDELDKSGSGLRFTEWADSWLAHDRERIAFNEYSRLHGFTFETCTLEDANRFHEWYANTVKLGLWDRTRAVL
jgi:hypothetical protein